MVLEVPQRGILSDRSKVRITGCDKFCNYHGCKPVEASFAPLTSQWHGGRIGWFGTVWFSSLRGRAG